MQQDLVSLSSGRLSDLQASLSSAVAGSTLDLCGAVFSGPVQGDLVLGAPGRVLLRNGKISLPDGCKVGGKGRGGVGSGLLKLVSMLSSEARN